MGYRRALISRASYFLTVSLLDQRSELLVDPIDKN